MWIHERLIIVDIPSLSAMTEAAQGTEALSLWLNFRIGFAFLILVAMVFCFGLQWFSGLEVFALRYLGATMDQKVSSMRFHWNKVCKYMEHTMKLCCMRKNLKNPQLSSASSKSFSRRQQTGHTRHKTKCLKFSCYSSHSLVEQHKVTRTSQNQKTAVPTADSRSKVVSDNVLRNNQ